MRVAITGATGNVGSSLVEILGEDERIDSIVGIARRKPDWQPAKTSWVAADVASDDLTSVFSGCDAVVHLAWVIQPSRDLEKLRAINVEGSRRVFDAVARAGVASLVYASSVGTYSPGPKQRRVDESWPTGGVQTSFYSRHKAEVETILDGFEAAHADTRVVRLRPGLIFKRSAASGQRRLFAGPFFPASLLLSGGRVPLIPDTPNLVFQAVHSFDVAEAYHQAVVKDVRGAFNVAAEPILDPPTLASYFGARSVPVPASVLRMGAKISFLLHLQPTPEGWVDMGLQTPIMDITRATTELGWSASRTSLEAIQDVVRGMADGAGHPTPPLEPDDPARRLHEIAGGVGHR